MPQERMAQPCAAAVNGPAKSPSISSQPGVLARATVICQLIKRYPHVLLVPLAVLGLLLGVGIWGVHRWQQEDTNQNRQSASWETIGAAQSLQSDIQRAMLPVIQIANLARDYPNITQFLQMFDTVVRSLWQAAPPGAESISLVIQGVVPRIYTPLPSPVYDYFLASNQTDFLALDSTFRTATLAAIQAGELALAGPFVNGDGVLVGTFTLPVFIANVSENETWGFNRQPTACPTGLCYNPETRTKWWGQVNMNVDVREMLSESPALESLAQKGYRAHLLRKGNAWANEANQMPVFATNKTVVVPGHAVLVPLTAINQQWELAVWKGDDWDNDTNYLYAVVVIGSLVIAVLLFTVLLAWVENRALLHSLLPKETIDRMRAEGQWATSQADEFKAIQLDTPVQGLLSIISTCLEGSLPALPRLLAMRDALQRSVDIYRPTAHTVKERMEQAEFVDAEVRRALVNQLMDSRQDTPNSQEFTGDQLSTDKITSVCMERRIPSLILDKLMLDVEAGPNVAGPRAPEHVATMIATTTADGNGCASSPGAVPSLTLMCDKSDGPVMDPYTAAMLQLLQQPGKTAPSSQRSLMPTQRTSMPGQRISMPAVLPIVQESCIKGTKLPAQTLMLYGAPDPSPTAGLLTQVEVVLSTADGWAFDAYALEEASCGHPLSMLGCWLLHSTGLTSWARMDSTKLVRFLQHIENGYSSANPYHNRRHAADVLQSIHVIMHHGGLMPGYVDQITMFACYMAAIVHDYEHKGRNNDFLVNSHDDLAVRYNDRSPMENHHLAAAFGLLKRPEFDCLSGLPKGTWAKLRKLVIELVLATDMKQHFAILGQFSILQNPGSETAPAVSAPPLVRHSLTDTRNSAGVTRPGGERIPLVPLSDNDKSLSLQMALKCADLGHLAAPLNVHLRWVKDLEEEFFLQGDAERDAGLALSPLCDRNKEGVYKSQVGFFDFVACPLFKAFRTRFPACTPMLKAVTSNQTYWQALASNKVASEVICQLIKRYPHVLLVPLAVLGLLLGVGIWGVHHWQQEDMNQNRQAATWEAVAAAQDLQADIEQGVLPLQQAADLAQDIPNVPQFLQLWDTIVKSWWRAAPRGANSIALTVQGIIVRLYSPWPSDDSILGTDYLDPSNPYYYSISRTIQAKKMALAGPFETAAGGQTLIIGSFTNPVFLANTSATETWGFTQRTSACPACYDNTTRSKLWGLISMNVDMRAMLAESPVMAALEQKRYSVQLLRKGVPAMGEPEQVPVLGASAAVAVPHQAVRVELTALDQQWELAVWKGDDWDNDTNYLYAVVVIGSLVIAVLLFTVLLARVENHALLHSLLPKETIARMRAEGHWAESQEDEFKAIQLDTPVQGLLSIISTCLEGSLPALPRLLAMRDALQRSVDIYRPTAHTVKERMEQAEFVDAEVRQALVAQLIDRRDTANDSQELNVEDLGRSTGDPPGGGLWKEQRKLNDGASFESPRVGLIVTGKSSAERLDVVIAHSASDGNRCALDPGTALAGRMPSLTLMCDKSEGPVMDPYAAAMLQLLQQPGRIAPSSQRSSMPALLPMVQESCIEGSELSTQTLMLYGPPDPSPTAGLLTQVEVVLCTADSWAFDAYALEEASCGHPLSMLGCWLLHSTGLTSWARMDSTKLIAFLQHIENGYSSANPYHNRRHAADVLQSIHVIMHHGGLMPGYVDQITMFACYMAAIVHDYEHKGRNNDFLVNSHDDLAVRYNDRSPMENHHLAAAFGLLKRPEFDCLSGLPKGTWAKLRKLVIELVLATDMKQHFATLGQFTALHIPATSGITRGTSGNYARDSLDASSHTESKELTAVAPLSDNDKSLSLQMALKCADLGHLAAPLNVHLRWVKDLEEEFFLQGDAERDAGLALSPLCDRNKEGVYKSQVGFFDFVACPLFKAFRTRFPACTPMLKAVTSNQRYWQAMASHKVASASNGSADARSSVATAEYSHGSTHGRRESMAGSLKFGSVPPSPLRQHPPSPSVSET